MALHSKWVNGNLVFYDGTLDTFRIQASEGSLFGTTGVGCLAKEYYVGTTGVIGVTVTATGDALVFTIVGGIVTGCAT